jgi:hypothetical protein
MVWLLLKENSGRPVMRLAMGQPWLKSLVLPVWLLRKLKLPPMSKCAALFNCWMRTSPPNFIV